MELVGMTTSEGLEVFINPFQVGHVIDCVTENQSDRRCIVSMRNGSEISLPCAAFKVARKIGVAGKDSGPSTR